MLYINHWRILYHMNKVDIQFIASSKRSDFENESYSHYKIIGSFWGDNLQISDSIESDTNAILLEPDGLPYTKLGVLTDQVSNHLKKCFNIYNLSADIITETKPMLSGDGDNILRFSFIIRNICRIWK